MLNKNTALGKTKIAFCLIFFSVLHKRTPSLRLRKFKPKTFVKTLCSDPL